MEFFDIDPKLRALGEQAEHKAREQFAQIGQIGRTTKKGGMGLGLAIVKSLLEAHSGALRIERLVPSGICCTVRLPLDLQQDGEQSK